MSNSRELKIGSPALIRVRNCELKMRNWLCLTLPLRLKPPPENMPRGLTQYTRKPCCTKRSRTSASEYPLSTCCNRCPRSSAILTTNSAMPQSVYRLAHPSLAFPPVSHLLIAGHTPIGSNEAVGSPACPRNTPQHYEKTTLTLIQPRSGDRMQPTAQAVAGKCETAEPQRGERQVATQPLLSQLTVNYLNPIRHRE